MPPVNGSNGTSVPVVAASEDAAPDTGWMSDVQRAIALILIGTLAAIAFIMAIRIVIWGDPTTIAALLKELKDAMVNMSLIALGFFFGNTIAKMSSDKSAQKITEKLTSTAPPGGPPGPVAPVPAPIIVVSWWSLLTPAEQAAVEAAAPNDPKVATILAAFKAGKAEAPDLAYLVTANLLTQVRADALKAD